MHLLTPRETVELFAYMESRPFFANAPDNPNLWLYLDNGQPEGGAYGVLFSEVEGCIEATVVALGWEEDKADVHFVAILEAQTSRKLRERVCLVLHQEFGMELDAAQRAAQRVSELINPHGVPDNPRPFQVQFQGGGYMRMELLKDGSAIHATISLPIAGSIETGYGSLLSGLLQAQNGKTADAFKFISEGVDD